MNNSFNNSLWNQYGASIDMLENAISMCPPEHWDTPRRFWYHAFHCLFFLDYYLTTNPPSFAPPSPFDFSEFEDRMPERTYTKAELLTYLQACRAKCRNLISNRSAEQWEVRWINESGTMNYSLFEISLYNMRHVQHHAAQLNLLLRQAVNDSPEWVYETNEPL